MILIPKIKESVTWIVYKRNGYRIESNKKYRTSSLNFSAHSSFLSSIIFFFFFNKIPENKHGIRASKLIPKRDVDCEKEID